MRNNSVTIFVAVVFVVGIVMWISVGIANAQTGIFDTTERFKAVPSDNLRTAGTSNNATLEVRFTAPENMRKVDVIKAPFIHFNSGTTKCRVTDFFVISSGQTIYSEQFSPYYIINDASIFYENGITQQEIENIYLWATFDLQNTIDIFKGESVTIRFITTGFCNGLAVGDSDGVNYRRNGSTKGRSGILVGGLNLYPALNFTSTSSDTIAASVISSVQNTTAPLVPVAGAMVGVPIAFVIGRRLISVIRFMV